MSSATYNCDCGNTVNIKFEVGKKPNAPICEKCGKEMKRFLGNIGKGDIMPSDLVDVSRMMAYQSRRK